MEETSLVGVVDIMTGEKDPRNLMVVFSILKVVMMEWDITHYVEVWCLIAQLKLLWLTLEASIWLGL